MDVCVFRKELAHAVCEALFQFVGHDSKKVGRLC